MKKGLKSISWVLLTLMLLCLTVDGFGQKSSVDQQRLNRDLRIMEGVLSKLLKGKTSYRFFNGHTKAVYLPNFGVVFHTNKERPVHQE